MTFKSYGLTGKCLGTNHRFVARYSRIGIWRLPGLAKEFVLFAELLKALSGFSNSFLLEFFVP